MTAQATPKFLWLDGEQVRWEDATVHVSELGWSTVGGVFEGIKAYWNEKDGELYVFRLREHLERLHRSMRLVRLAGPLFGRGVDRRDHRFAAGQ